MLEVSSVSELQDLIKKTKKENRIAVLEVRRTKASPAVEAFAEKYEGMADEFKDRAVFATLLQDKTEATKLAAKVLSPNIAYRTHPKNPMRVYPGGITLTRALGGRPLKMKSSCPVVADAETATVPVAGATHVTLAALRADRALRGGWRIL